MQKKTSSSGRPSKANVSKSRKAPTSQRRMVTAPVACSLTSGTSRAAMQVTNLPDGGIRVRRSEFAGTLTNSSSNFEFLGASALSPGYDFNPASTHLFPWLSNLARNYERFRFNSLGFRLIASQGTATSGRVYAAVDYDYDDPVPLDKVQMMNNRTTAEGPVWTDITLSCSPTELSRDIPYRYISLVSRNNFVEPRTAYSGYLMIATDATAGCRWDLEVSYDVTLVLPVLETSEFLSTVGPTATPVTYVTEPKGSTYARFLKDMVSSTTSPIVRVVPGTQDVPPLEVTWNGIGYADTALDVSKVGNDGFLGLEAWFTGTGLTPETILTDCLAFLAGYCYDSTGKLLGEVTSAAGSKSLVGPLPRDGMELVNSGVKVITDIAMTALLKAFPTVKYIVPLLISNTEIGAGTLKQGYTFSW